MSLADRLERIAQHHHAATGPRWYCRVTGCPIADVAQPAANRAAAFVDADAHYDARHATPPPADLEEQRAAWVAAGRPPLGLFAATR